MKKFIFILLLLPVLLACNKANESNEVLQAEAIAHDDRCHLCGMMIKKYPGPKGQLRLKGEDLVPKFCSTRDMFNYSLQAENKRQITLLMVHDMSLTSWADPDDSTFIDASSAWYVYGASRQAVMGPAVASFGTKQGAEQFADEFGGAVLEYEQIDLALLGD